MATSIPSGKTDKHFDQYFYSFLQEHRLASPILPFEEGLRIEEPGDAFDAYYPSRVEPWIAYDQVKKFAHWPAELDWDLFWFVNDHMVELYKLFIDPCKPVKIDSVVANLDLSKSPGRLWRHFGNDKLEVLENEEGASLLLYDVSRALCGENVRCHQSASLKSEMRSKQKVFKNPPSTRLFLGSDFANLCVSHTYSLDFNLKFCDKAFMMDHAVGPGKFYGNTHKIFRALMKFEAVMSYDNREWDGHVYEMEIKANSIIRYHCFEKKFKIPLTQQVLANMVYANTHSPMIMPDGLIVRNMFAIKNPSGQGNTTQDNTMTHQRRFYMFWFSTAPDEMKNFRALEWHTVRFFYSDDGIVSVSSEVLSWCNIVKYAEWCAKYGWILEHGPMRSAMEAEFLGTTPAFFGVSIVPRLTFARCFCGLLKGAPSPVRDPLYSFERACAYRLENYFNDEFRTMIEEYLRWLIHNYPIALRDTGMYLSQSEICRLYGVPDNSWRPSDFKESNWVQMVKHIPSENESLKTMPRKRNGKRPILEGVSLPASTPTVVQGVQNAVANHVSQGRRARDGQNVGGKQGLEAVTAQVREITKVKNQYLHQLVLPELHGPAAYPDQFDTKSTTWRSIINMPLPYLDAAVGATPAGTFLAIVRPVLKDPVMCLVKKEGTTTRICLQGQTQTENYGLFSTHDRDHTISQPTQTMEFTTQWQNLVTPVQYGAGDEVGTMFHGVSSDGYDFFGTPFAGGTAQFICQVQLSAQLPAGHTILIRTITTAGVQSTQTMAQIGTSTLYTVTWTPSANDPGLPGNGVQFCLGGTATVDTVIPVLSINVKFVNDIDGIGTPYLQLESYQIPDVSVALDLFDMYRVVACSTLTTYRGSLLDNGGQIAGTLFRGGEPPTINDLYTYDQVAQAPQGHDGPLLDGSYTFWLPADTVDMSFREHQTTDSWVHPYMVTAGVVADPAQVNSLRLRVVLNYEAVSRSQLLHYEDSRVSPQEIAHAAQVLRGKPTSFSNKSHLKELEAFLRKAIMEIPKILSWMNDNKSWLIPAAGAVGSFLL